MTLAKSMPVKRIAEMVGETDVRVWRILHHYVDEARERTDYSSIEKVGVDMQILNGAVDEVRREEQKERPELKKTRYIWLKNPENLSSSQREKLEDLKMSTQNPETARAWQIRLNFQEFWEQPVDAAEDFLKKWFFRATHSCLEPIKQAAYTIRRHWDGSTDTMYLACSQLTADRDTIKTIYQKR